MPLMFRAHGQQLGHSGSRLVMCSACGTTLEMLLCPAWQLVDGIRTTSDCYSANSAFDHKTDFVCSGSALLCDPCAAVRDRWGRNNPRAVSFLASWERARWSITFT